MKTPATATEVRERVLSAFKAAFPDQDLQVRELPIDDLVIMLPAADIAHAVHVLVEDLGLTHLSTITGDHRDEDIRLLYHFWDGCGITLETSLPVDAPQIETLTTLIPGASFYEREVFEMFGVVFAGHPDLRPLLLPDDWDEGPPLLQSTKLKMESES